MTVDYLATAARADALASIIADLLRLERTGAVTETKSEVTPSTSTFRSGGATSNPDWRLHITWRWKHARGESLFQLDFDRDKARSLRNALDLWLKETDRDIEQLLAARS